MTSRRGDGDNEDNPGKMFVGGLSWDTEEAHLQNYFGKFGELVDTHVMLDKMTGKSRFFGFITFKDPACVETVLSSVPHIINSKQVDAKLCNKKAAAAERAKRGGSGEKNKKVFVGGLPAQVDQESLKAFFGEFGTVVESVIVIDPLTQRPRGFGFVTFESDEAVENVCKVQFHTMQGKQIECKAAQPRQPGASRPAAQDQGQNWSQGYQGPYGPPAQHHPPPYGGGVYGMDAYGYGQPQQQYNYPQQGGYPPPGAYDYSMGGAYAQQQSSYGPDRTNSYGGTYGGSYGSTDSSGAYAAQGAYASGSYAGGQEQSGYGQAPAASGGSSRGYHPYGR